MNKTFRPWDVEQRWLFPPSVLDLVPEDHLAHFVREVVRNELDLSSIYSAYTEERGQPPYHPAMMTALLLYACSRGVYSSRRIERACVERIDFMAVTAMGKRPPRGPSEVPKDKAQSNFTDPESRIMKTSGGFEQCYNCQLTVDADSQVIVTNDVITKQNDVDQVESALRQIESSLDDQPDEFSADAGYCSEQNLALLEARGIRGYVATGRQKHGTDSATGRLPDRRRRERQGPLTTRMRARLRRGGYSSRYRLRKKTVEPVIGQIKEARGFRQFLMRGLAKVKAEWSLRCTAHNLLKLAKASGCEAVVLA